MRVSSARASDHVEVGESYGRSELGLPAEGTQIKEVEGQPFLNRWFRCNYARLRQAEVQQ